MNEGFDKFRELLLTDAEFQAKLGAAAESVDSGMTEEEVFSNVLTPLAAEYGITATFSEFKAYVKSLSESTDPMSPEELEQVAGGEGKGAGVSACYAAIGVGFAGGSDFYDDDPDKNRYAGCIVIGAGQGASACWGKGYWK